MRRHQKYTRKLPKIKIDAQKSEECCSRILTIKNGSNPVFEPNILAGVEGLSRFASSLLAHPNASHFGTGLRTFLLKNSHPDCFLTQKPSQASSPFLTKKSQPKRIDSFFTGVEGLSRFASSLLAHPNASHFGTGLRTFLLKNSHPDCFFNAKTLSGFESFLN